MVEAERWKVKHFPGSLEVCPPWTETIIKEATSLIEFYELDFVKELNEQQQKLMSQIKEAQLRLHQASAALVPHTRFLSEHSRALLHFLRNPHSLGDSDPWIHEISMRHGAATFLREKESFLSTLQELFNQTRLCDAEMEQQMERLRFAFFSRIRQSQRVIAAQTDFIIGQEVGAADVHAGSYNSPQPGFQMLTESSQWQQILAAYSLSHEWQLQIAPLDGFLSFLFNFLKSACEDVDEPIHTQLDPEDRLPRLLPDAAIKSGFLMRPTKGLLSRSWNTCYAVLQKETRFLHIYKPSFTAQAAVGNVHVPQPGSSYSKQTISDLNSLADQFLHASHHPGGVDRLLCSPHVSIKLTPDCGIGSDPVSGAFSIKTVQDKVTLRAFCEEDMVDWVISLKDTIKPKPKPSLKKAAAEPEVSYAQDHEQPAPVPQFFPENASLGNTMYADIEDPWSK